MLTPEMSFETLLESYLFSPPLLWFPYLQLINWIWLVAMLVYENLESRI